MGLFGSYTMQGASATARIESEAGECIEVEGFAGRFVRPFDRLAALLTPTTAALLGLDASSAVPLDADDPLAEFYSASPKQASKVSAATVTSGGTSFPSFPAGSSPALGETYPLVDDLGRTVGHISSRISPDLVHNWPATHAKVQRLTALLSANLDIPLCRNSNATITLDPIPGAEHQCWRPDLCYKGSAAENEATDKFISEGLAHGYLTQLPLAPGASVFTKPPGRYWSCIPVFSVTNTKVLPDGSISSATRPVGDMRHPNTLIIPNAPPIGNMVDHIAKVRASSCITAVDAKSGFYAVPVVTDPDSSIVVTFPYRGVLYRFNALTMGGLTSPGHYTAWMESFGGSLPPEVRSRFTSYIDDAALAHDSLTTVDGKFDPLPQLDEAIAFAERMASPEGFLHSPAKSQFLVDSAKVCGLYCGSAFSTVTPEAAANLLDLQPPTTAHQARVVAGVFASLSAQVPGLGACAGTLSQLGVSAKGDLARYADPDLHARGLDAFHVGQALVRAANAESLRTWSFNPDPAWVLCLYTDASRDGLAAVAVQRHLPPATDSLSAASIPPEWASEPLDLSSPGTRLIAVAARACKAAERYRSASSLEILALDLAASSFASFFTGRPYVLFSDNRALVCRLTATKTHPKTCRVLGALTLGTRCIPVHIDGARGNVLADAISRAFVAPPTESTDIFSGVGEELDVEYNLLRTSTIPEAFTTMGFGARLPPPTASRPRLSAATRRVPRADRRPLPTPDSEDSEEADPSDFSDLDGSDDGSDDPDLPPPPSLPDLPGLRRDGTTRVVTFPLYRATDGSIIPAVSDPSSPWHKGLPFRDPGNEVDRTALIEWAHLESAHRSTDAVLHLLHQAGHHWKGIRKHVIHWCVTCTPCQRWAPWRVHTGPSPVDLWSETRIGAHLAVDVLELAKDDAGFSMVFVALDVASSFIWCYPLRSQTAVDLVTAMELVMSFNGPPATVTSDNHPSFTSGAFAASLRAWGAEHRPTSDRSHSNIAETACRAVGDALRKATSISSAGGSTRQWRVFLQGVVSQLNGAYSRRRGVTPFEAYHGRLCRLPFPSLLANDKIEDEALFRATVADRVSQLRDSHDVLGPARAREYSTSAEARLAAQPPGNLAYFKVGSLVLVRRPDRASKNEPRGSGPYRVVNRSTGGSYWLARLDGTVLRSRYPAARLKPFQERFDGSALLEEEVSIVERILDDREDAHGRVEYLTKWEGYDEPTWNPQENFIDTAAIVDYFALKDHRGKIAAQAAQAHRASALSAAPQAASRPSAPVPGTPASRPRGGYPKAPSTKLSK